MLDKFLTLKLWQGLGVLVAIIGVLLTIVFQLTKKKRSALTYTIQYNTPIVSAKLPGRLEVRFDGKAVQGVNLLLIKITNSGNVPITSQDYEIPLSLLFHKEAEVLMAKVTKTSPSSLRGLVTPSIEESNRVQIPPVLMNAGDYIVVSCVVGNYSGTVTAKGRVVGVRDIEQRAESSRRSVVLNLLSALMGVFGLIFTLASNQHLPIAQWLLIGTMVLIIISSVVGILLVRGRS